MDPLKVTPPQETKLHFLDYWRIIRIRKTVILAVFLLVVITATLVTFILPESFSSMARIKIERDGSILMRAMLEKDRSEEHTSELQSLKHLVCRLLLEKKNS